MFDNKNEIRAAAEHFLRVLDDLDWDSFVECWSLNPTTFFPGDDSRLDGRESVFARFRVLFDQVPARFPGPPYLHLNPRGLRIDQYGDAGLVTFTLGEPPKPIALRSLVFMNENGVWKLAHLHGTGLPQAIAPE